MAGTEPSEEISTGKSTGKNIYVMTGGKWIDMQTSFAAMEGSKCKALPDEAMYGQPASVYSQSNPDLGVETKFWISKTTNLPVRTDMTNDQEAMKVLTVSRYEYSGVQAPAHTMTMKEMVKSSGR
jgi:hypothetical protein